MPRFQNTNKRESAMHFYRHVYIGIIMIGKKTIGGQQTTFPCQHPQKKTSMNKVKKWKNNGTRFFLHQFQWKIVIARLSFREWALFIASRPVRERSFNLWPFFYSRYTIAYSTGAIPNIKWSFLWSLDQLGKYAFQAIFLMPRLTHLIF